MVVNDRGGAADGTGVDAGPAAAVVEEIIAAGGVAVADGNDVATGPGAEALVGAALEHYGRIDVLINNAGIMRWAGFPEVDAEDLSAHLAVHVGGSFNTTRAAWPHLVEQGYGRIVMTTSTGMLGLPANTAYATAKAGVVGLTRSAAVAGARSGIKVNLIAPAATTRMAGEGGARDAAGARRADGGVPRPRVMSRKRRDLHRRRRPVRPAVHRVDGRLRARGDVSENRRPDH